MAGNHRRNTAGMHAAQRCRAKTRTGTPCAAPAVHGKERCRMHGGSQGSGAPKGNRNALRHGLYAAEAIELRKLVIQLLREGRETLEKI